MRRRARLEQFRPAPITNPAQLGVDLSMFHEVSIEPGRPPELCWPPCWVCLTAQGHMQQAFDQLYTSPYRFCCLARSAKEIADLLYDLATNR